MQCGECQYGSEQTPQNGSHTKTTVKAPVHCWRAVRGVRCVDFQPMRIYSIHSTRAIFFTTKCYRYLLVSTPLSEPQLCEQQSFKFVIFKTCLISNYGYPSGKKKRKNSTGKTWFATPQAIPSHRNVMFLVLQSRLNFNPLLLQKIKNRFLLHIKFPTKFASKNMF